MVTNTKRVIDCNAVVRHIGQTETSEFDKKRCEKEYDAFMDRIEEIASKPYYRWSDKKHTKH